MKALLVALLSISLTACGMSYEEVEQADAYCADKGLKTLRLHNNEGNVAAVRCIDDDGTVFYPEVN